MDNGKQLRYCPNRRSIVGGLEGELRGWPVPLISLLMMTPESSLSLSRNDEGRSVTDSVDGQQEQ